MTYSPQPTPATIQREAQQYLAQEFRKLKDTLDVVEVQTFDQLAAEPERLADGMLAYADGSNWNPGAGEGLYMRRAGAWTQAGNFGLDSDDLSDVASIAMLDEAETISGAWTFTGSPVTFNRVDLTAASGQLLLEANATTSRAYISTRTVGGTTYKVFTRAASADA